MTKGSIFTYHTVHTHPLILGERMTLLPQTDSNPINNLG